MTDSWDHLLIGEQVCVLATLALYSSSLLFWLKMTPLSRDGSAMEMRCIGDPIYVYFNLRC